MNILYIVRHGKTDWNEKGLFQGSIDTNLNDTGINDAKKLSENINLDEIDVCISSPLKRAKQTAEIIVKNKLNIIYDDLLKERSFGNHEGKKVDFDLVKKHWDYKLNESDDNIESIKECLDRAKVFLNKLKENYSNKKILIVTHAGIAKALHFNLMGYDENTDFLSFYPQNTTLYKYIQK